jgi:hypothetical protein
MLSIEYDATLIKVVRVLPPEQTHEVWNWARQLADLPNGREIELSDAWTDEDIADVTAFSLRGYEGRERNGG